MKDSFPMILHDDIFVKLHGSNYFSIIDFASGYWQVPIREEDIPNTAFITPFGLYEWLVMPFGLCNAPATFQRFVNNLLNSNNLLDYCSAKIDDLLIYSKTFDEHLKHVDNVLKSIKEKNARLKLKKCDFGGDNVVYLGNIISKEGILPDPAKIQSVLNFKNPENVKDIRSFLGLTNYYRQFIPGYASISSSLCNLLKKNTTFKWGEEEEKAFIKLKNCLVSAPVLKYPDLNAQFVVQTDASYSGIGCVLLQQYDGINHPICFYSRSLQSHEKNYSVGALEALAIVYAAKKLRQYVYDNPNVIVQTDHRSLQYIKTYKGSNNTAARWWIKIDDAFNKAKIEYIKGKDNFIADALSRMFLSKEVLVEKQKEDEKILKLKEEKKLDERYFINDNDLFCFKGKTMVPESLKCEILYEFHEKMNHIGVSKMIDSISKNYYWKNMNSSIARWCSSCSVCQKKKISRIKKETGVSPHHVGYPWKRIQVDYIGPMIRSVNGNSYILTVIDQFTKYGEAFAVPNNTGKITTKILEDEILLRYGIPDEIFSDRGTHFKCKEMSDLCAKYNIVQKFTSSYNAASNGLCERYNATLVDLLNATISNTDSVKWCNYLRQIVNTYNGTIQSSTKSSPFELLFGFSSILPVDKRLQHKFPDVPLTRFVTDAQENLLKRRKDVKDKLELIAKKMEKNFINVYKEGDLVLVKNQTKIQEDKSTKFQDRFLGPFRIGIVNNAAAPQVLNLDGTFYDNISVRNLKKYNPSEFDFDRNPTNYISGVESENVYDDEFLPTPVPEVQSVNKSPQIRRSSRRRKPVTSSYSIPFEWIDQDPDLSTPIESDFF